MATVLAEYFSDTAVSAEMRSVVVNCGTDDTFTTLWHNVFVELGIDHDRYEMSPEVVRRHLQAIAPAAIVVIDELDRLTDDDALTALADTIKTLSDHAVASTLILVGVARSIGELVGEHASIVRALQQIEMPRMTSVELSEIMATGCDRAGISVQPDAVSEIAALSEGLPHYTHLLALHAGQHAVQNDRTEITTLDVRRAIPKSRGPAHDPQ